jgi:hypothetical protein
VVVGSPEAVVRGVLGHESGPRQAGHREKAKQVWDQR